jgi:pseudouridine synthase
MRPAPTHAIDFILPAHGYVLGPMAAGHVPASRPTAWPRGQGAGRHAGAARGQHGRLGAPRAYDDVPPRMWPVAKRSLLAHVQRIEALLLVPGAQASDDTSGIRVLQRHFANLKALTPLPTEASGLVVFTQDWHVERKLTEDAEAVEQEVMCEVAGAVTPGQLQRLCHGLGFNGRPLPPIKVSVSSSNEVQTRLRFALKGIRPGQVPYMCESVGLRLLALKRIRIGRVAMAGLAPGQWRYLLAHERF